jgi:uncharacterized protein YoaH (UPF0181 family)
MEAYSAHMLAALQHEVQQVSALRLVELAAYYRRRQGPGLALVAAELRDRQARRLNNYPPKHAV